MMDIPAENATFFDGDQAVPHRVQSLTKDQGSLRIHCDDGLMIDWPIDTVRQLPDTARGTLLHLPDDKLSRLYLPSGIAPGTLPNLTKRAPPKGRVRLAVWAIAAVLAVALQVFVFVPRISDQLARFIPPAGERALGEAALGQIRSLLDTSGLNPIGFCTNETGTAALRAMEDRLAVTQDGAPVDITLHVLDHKMINAFAAPGGIVVLFRGLIDAADSPDEVAAVLAHEIGHVVNRDPTRNALRTTGSVGILGLLFGDFAGGAVMLMLAERLVSAQYSQDAETKADEFAADTLSHAGLSPDALATFFTRLQKQGGDADALIGHFMSHPDLADRISAAQKAGETPNAGPPALPDDAWRDLRDICKS